MSLTAHLLFGKPTRLPMGRIRVHNPDARRLAPLTTGQLDNAARNQDTRLMNVERVFNAVADGVDTIHALVDQTELSDSTVNKALHTLEDWRGGARIVRIKGARHRFVVAEIESGGTTKKMEDDECS